MYKRKHDVALYYWRWREVWFRCTSIH